MGSDGCVELGIDVADGGLAANVSSLAWGVLLGIGGGLEVCVLWDAVVRVAAHGRRNVGGICHRVSRRALRKFLDNIVDTTADG